MFYLCKSDMEYDSMRDRIFVLVKEQKLTQKELAEKLDISPQTITDWKKKKSNSFSGMIGKLSSVLQTTPAWLYAGIGQKYMTDQEKAEKDKLILQVVEANGEKLRQDAISSIKAALETIKQHGLFPELISECPNFVEDTAQLLGTTPRELLGIDSSKSFQKMDAEIFVQNIKTLCKSKGITPTNACEESGAGRNFMDNIKKGSIPSVAKVQMLAEYLGVTVSELLGEKTASTIQDDELSDGERALMTEFRQLTPEQQEMVIRMVKAAADKL